MSVSVTWGGQAAAKGLQSFTQSLNTMSGVADHARKSLAGMMPSNLFSATGIKGLADMKAGLEMVRGVFNTFVAAPINLAANIVKMGAEMESAGIRMGALMGNMQAGNDVMKALSRAAMATGVPFADMAKGMRSLIQSGMSAEAAAEVIEKMQNAMLLMGGGAEGFQAAVDAVNQLQQNAVAAEAPLKALQDAGIPVFEKLAETLSAMFGRVVGMDEAMQMVRQGAVMTATALDAVFKAGNAGKVKEAANALRDTVENQIKMASVGIDEVIRNIGFNLIKAFDPARALASFRGMLDGIMAIVQQIADTFLPMIDPKQKQKGIENAFKFARDMTFTIAEELAKAAITFKNTMMEAVRFFRGNLSGLLLAWMEFQQTFFYSPLQKGALERAKEEFNRAFDIGPGVNNEMKNVTEFFAKARAAADAQDKARMNDAAKAMADLANAAKNANPPLDANANAKAMAGLANAAKNANPPLDANANAKAMADLANAAKNAKPPLDANAKAIQAQAFAAKEAAAKVELMNKNIKDQADKMFADFATPMERFAEKIQRALDEVAQIGGPQKARFQAAMRRRVGADIEAFLKEFGPKAAEPAQAQLAGSAAAIESDIRARMEAEAGQQDLPALMKQAMENAKEQNAQQIKKLDELVNAAHAAGMFRTIMALPKP